MFGRRSSRVGILVNNGIKTIFFYRFATDVTFDVPRRNYLKTTRSPTGSLSENSETRLEIK